MKIVVLAGGLSPERNVSLSSGTMIAHALKRLGHRPALVDLYFGLEDPAGPLEACFDQPVPDRWKQVDPQAPDLEAVKAALLGESPSQFGPGVLELCRQADLVFPGPPRGLREDGRVQAAFDLMGIPYTGSGYVGSALAMDKDLTKRLVAPLGGEDPPVGSGPTTRTGTLTAHQHHPGALRGKAGGQRVLHRRVHRPH